MFKNNNYYTKSKRFQSFDCLFCIRLEIEFLGKFGRKTQNCQFKQKFGAQTNSNMQNSIVMSTFSVSAGNTLLGKYDPKNQNCQFELKFGTQTNSNTQNSMVVFNFSVLDPKKHFWGKSGPKTQNCQFKLKFGTMTNSNMWNSFTMLTLSVFDHKYFSWAHLIQKFKIVYSK